MSTILGPSDCSEFGGHHGKTHEWQGISTYHNWMPMQSWDQNNIVHKHIQRLAKIRKHYIALRRGTQREMWEESSVYAYSRRKEAMILAPDVTETYTPVTPTLTTIRVHYNTGLDNSIWIRGSQYPFWWDDGRSMRWTTGDVWEWETERIGQAITVEVKPLINDYTWSVGSNFIITGGESVYIYPSFHDSSTTTTQIRVRYNVGSGNSIYIRGSTAPLSWSSGQQASWTAGNVWVWETTSIGEGTQFEFKPLKNDTTWSQGNNYGSRGGLTVEIYPSFP